MESVSCPLVVPGISSLVFHIYGISGHSARLPSAKHYFYCVLWGHLGHFIFKMIPNDLVISWGHRGGHQVISYLK